MKAGRKGGGQQSTKLTRFWILC